MSKLVDDTMLDTFCVSGTYDEIVPKLRERYGHVTRFNLNMPEDRRYDDRLGAVVEELQRG